MPAFLLIHVLPKSGFSYPQEKDGILTMKQAYDHAIQKAIRNAGIRWSRPEIAKLLIAVFEMATVTVQAVYVPPCDAAPIMAVYGAIDVVHRATPWAANLDPSIFHQLVFAIRAARRISLKTHGVDQAKRGSWAARVANAVDRFDQALEKMGWSGSNELRALEGGCTDQDEDIIRWARRNVAAAGEESLRDTMEGVVLGFVGMAEDEQDEVEIFTETAAGETGDVEMRDADDDGLMADERPQSSIEPYLGRD